MQKKSKIILGISLGIVTVASAISIPLAIHYSLNKSDHKTNVSINQEYVDFLFSENGKWFNKTVLTPDDFDKNQNFKIDRQAFANQKNLKKITIGENVSLGDNAFGNSHFDEIFIPDIDLNIEWKNSITGYYSMFALTKPTIIIHLPNRYRDNATTQKLGLTSLQFENIQWHGIHDPNNPSPI